MASSQKYFCFKCRDAGFPNEEITFAGKDEQGKTIYKNPDSTSHEHKTKDSSTVSTNIVQNEQPKTEYDKSVDNGISAFSHITSLIRLVEQNQHVLQGLEQKIDHLTKLVFALSEQQHDKAL